MTTKAYEFVNQCEKFIEPKIVEHMWKLMEQYNYPAGKIEQRYFIEYDAHVIGRYIESTYLDGVEICTLQISGRMMDVMPVGYREKPFQSR